MRTFSFFLTVSIVTLSALSPMLTQAEEEAKPSAGGAGSLLIQQVGPENTPNVIGSWTLIHPTNVRTESSDESYSFDELVVGNYAFSAKIPEGASAKIEVYRNGELEEVIERQQATITLGAGESVRIKIIYEYTRVGVVSVTSSPPGLTFSMKGPNTSEFSGTTPKSFTDVPEGQYTVYFDEIADCITPRPQSNRLEKDSRIQLNIEVSCDGLAEKVPEIVTIDSEIEFITITIDGKQVVYTDTPTVSWFAPHVHMVIKAGIMTGYENPGGRFGPGDNVTLAQLAKIAHEVAAVDEEKIRVPVENARASGTWFERYFASAEQRWWEAFRDRRVDPSRPATRGEVIVTLLRALNVQRVWPEGKLFADVTPSTKYASSIETAGASGLVDVGGNFRSNDPVNRAEVAKMLSNAIDLYIKDTGEIQGYDQ